jgi:ankyrin repeat protein
MKSLKSITRIPRDILLAIASHLILPEYLRLQSCCRALHAALSQSKPFLTFPKYVLSLSYLSSKKIGYDPSTELKILFEQDTVDSIFLFLIRHSHEAEFQRLLSLPNLVSKISKNAKDMGVMMAFRPEKYSRISVSICALLVFLVDDCAFIDECFLLVCSMGNFTMVSRFMDEKRNKIHLTHQNYLAFRTACKKGHVEIVKLLLKEPDIDPSADYNYAIKWASSNNHVQVLRLLLNDGRANPGANMQLAIRLACKYSHIESVALLLQDSRVDASVEYNQCIREAAMKGRNEIVEQLLQNNEVNPADRDNFALRAACLNGHIKCVTILLQDGRVDASDENYQALQWSIEKKHVDIVRMLVDFFREVPLPLEIQKQIQKLFYHEQNFQTSLSQTLSAFKQKQIM